MFSQIVKGITEYKSQSYANDKMNFWDMKNLPNYS